MTEKEKALELEQELDLLLKEPTNKELKQNILVKYYQALSQNKKDKEYISILEDHINNSPVL